MMINKFFRKFATLLYRTYNFENKFRKHEAFTRRLHYINPASTTGISIRCCIILVLAVATSIQGSELLPSAMLLNKPVMGPASQRCAENLSHT